MKAIITLDLDLFQGDIAQVAQRFWDDLDESTHVERDSDGTPNLHYNQLVDSVLISDEHSEIHEFYSKDVQMFPEE